MTDPHPALPATVLIAVLLTGQALAGCLARPSPVGAAAREPAEKGLPASVEEWSFPGRNGTIHHNFTDGEVAWVHVALGTWIRDVDARWNVTIEVRWPSIYRSDDGRWTGENKNWTWNAEWVSNGTALSEHGWDKSTLWGTWGRKQSRGARARVAGHPLFDVEVSEQPVLETAFGDQKAYQYRYWGYSEENESEEQSIHQHLASVGVKRPVRNLFFVFSASHPLYVDVTVNHNNTPAAVSWGGFDDLFEYGSRDFDCTVCSTAYWGHTQKTIARYDMHMETNLSEAAGDREAYTFMWDPAAWIGGRGIGPVTYGQHTRTNASFTRPDGTTVPFIFHDPRRSRSTMFEVQTMPGTWAFDIEASALTPTGEEIVMGTGFDPANFFWEE